MSSLSPKSNGIALNTDIISDDLLGDFIIGEKLGEGTFSKVCQGIHKKTKEKVAIKILSKTQIKDPSDKKRIEKEICILKRLHHNCIIQQYCIIETKSFICIITEYCGGGELFDYIISKRKLYEVEACRIFQQLISGLEYLHKQSIVHRDIKPENLLFDSKHNLKIADFGLSNDYIGELSTPCGSPCYAAPEMVTGKKYNGVSVDIWSSGIVLYTMVCGYLPFEDDNQYILFNKIANGLFKLPLFLSASCKDLLKNILVTDPNKRFGFEEIKKHPWFMSVNNVMGRNILFNSPGIFINKDVIPIDEYIVIELIMKMGFDLRTVINDVIRNKHNNITTCYYLLLKRKVRNGEKSVADISSNSQAFLNYIKTPIYKMSYWNNDIKAIIDFYYRKIFNIINGIKREANAIIVKRNKKHILNDYISHYVNANTITNRKVLEEKEIINEGFSESYNNKDKKSIEENITMIIGKDANKAENKDHFKFSLKDNNTVIDSLSNYKDENNLTDVIKSSEKIDNSNKCLNSNKKRALQADSNIYKKFHNLGNQFNQFINIKTTNVTATQDDKVNTEYIAIEKKSNGLETNQKIPIISIVPTEPTSPINGAKFKINNQAKNITPLTSIKETALKEIKKDKKKPRSVEKYNNYINYNFNTEASNISSIFHHNFRKNQIPKSSNKSNGKKKPYHNMKNNIINNIRKIKPISEFYYSNNARQNGGPNYNTPFCSIQKKKFLDTSLIIEENEKLSPFHYNLNTKIRNQKLLSNNHFKSKNHSIEHKNNNQGLEITCPKKNGNSFIISTEYNKKKKLIKLAKVKINKGHNHKNLSIPKQGCKQNRIIKEKEIISNQNKINLTLCCRKPIAKIKEAIHSIIGDQVTMVKNTQRTKIQLECKYTNRWQSFLFILNINKLTEVKECFVITINLIKGNLYQFTRVFERLKNALINDNIF